MGISENFLVNTKSFDPIIKAFISRSEPPGKISDATLEEMGYDNPSDLLVIHVLRGLDIINQDKTPSDLYYKMVDPLQTKEAIAEGIINGYRDLFEQNYNIHKMLPGELQEELKDYFDGKKTDLIVKYIANTFHKLVTYAGPKYVEKARDEMIGPQKEETNEDKVVSAEDTASESGKKDNSLPNFKEDLDQQEVGKKNIEDILFGEKRGKPEEQQKTESSDSASANVPKDEKEEDSERKEEVETKEESELKEVSEQAKSEPVIKESKTTDTDNDSPEEEPAKSNLKTSDELVQKAFIKRAELQYKLEHYEDALKSAEQIISYFDEAGEDFLKNAVSNAIIRRVELVNKLGQEHKLLPALNEVIRRFGNSDKQKYYDQASGAMLQKAELLEQKGYEGQELRPLYDTIINRLKDESDPGVQEKVNNIFIKRLALLNRAGDQSELLKALEESIQRFKGSKHFRKYLEETMFRKAEVLEEMNRNEEALEAYTTFLEEFGQAIET